MMKFHALAAATLFAVATLLLLFALGADARRAPDGRKLTKAYTYEQYVRDFQRTDRTAAEHALRRPIFEAERDAVIAHNSQMPRPSWWKGLNDFSDWTAAEKKDRLTNKNYRGLKKHQKTRPRRIHTAASGASSTPFQVDWTRVTPPVVTAVKNQLMCGSCWAHASTETMESRWALATGQLNDLSQEQVTACTPNPQECGGTGGCNGATHELAYEYATSAGGLTEEWIYPYTSGYGVVDACKAVNDEYFVRATFDGYVKIATNDPAALMSAVAEGPVAVTIAAVPFLNYEGGVFKGCGLNNASIDLDHGVQMVGYGVDQDAGMNYWLIRNSWSPSWGDSGYIRVFRAATPAAEACGWDNTPQDGVACKGDNQPEYVCCECGVCYDTSYPIAAPSN